MIFSILRLFETDLRILGILESSELLHMYNEVFLFQVTIPCEQDRVRVA